MLLLSINAPKVVQWLQQLARQQGTTPTEVAEQLLSTQLSESTLNESAQARPLNASEQPLPFYATASDEEWTREFEAWINSHPRRAPLPVTAFERESFYEDERHLATPTR